MIESLIISYASMFGISASLALAVAQVESNFRMDRVGLKGEVGIFQLMPEAFPKYSKQDLKKMKINILLGVKHLAYSRTACKFKEGYGWLVCFNRGVVGGSRLASYKNDSYYRKVLSVMKEFEKGDKVRIKNFHGGSVDATGTIWSKNKGQNNPDYWIVDVDDISFPRLCLNPEQLEKV